MVRACVCALVAALTLQQEGDDARRGVARHVGANSVEPDDDVEAAH
jgi:hypothetical protein